MKGLILALLLSMAAGASAQTAPRDSMTHFTPTQVRTLYAHVLNLKDDVRERDSLIVVLNRQVKNYEFLAVNDSLIIGTQMRTIAGLRERETLYRGQIEVLMDGNDRAWYDNPTLRMIIGGVVTVVTYVTLDAASN